jgi:hypothetical protein
MATISAITFLACAAVNSFRRASVAALSHAKQILHAALRSLVFVLRNIRRPSAP